MVAVLNLLLDTNIWLELLLAQQKADEVQEFLSRSNSSDLALTDFTLYSIGIILTRHHKFDLFADFVADTLEHAAIQLVSLGATEMQQLVVNQQQLRLDFDDAYQYTAAVVTGRSLVSFDTDFDRTPLKRLTPDQIT
ncbi:MAG: PIN domain-containing protein [Geobacter sp.]|nr:PIN domain-containing protein [Geobacter sp.]